MTDYTPGPWCSEFKAGAFVIRGTQATLNVSIAQVVYWSSEDSANARLIAAAPDLLAALKAVVENHCGNDKLFCSTCTPARDVIAKAEGR